MSYTTLPPKKKNHRKKDIVFTYNTEEKQNIHINTHGEIYIENERKREGEI